jgi:predicted small metal-binding protein
MTRYAWCRAVSLGARERRFKVKEFRCGVLVPGCWATFHGESDDEILKQVVAHAREEHGMDEVPPEVVDEIRSEISER